MIVGNLAITKSGEIITISLNSYYKGVPQALLTENEIASLVAVLKDLGPKAKPQKLAEVKVEDEINWEDLI